MIITHLLHCFGVFFGFFFFHISPQMCVYLFLMFLPPYRTFQFGTFDTNMPQHFAAAPKKSKSEKESCSRGERERPGDFPTVGACVLGVTLVNNLLPILQLGCTFRTLQTMKTAGFVQSPTVRVSFAVDDGNIKPVSREWTSQSESLQLS